MNPSTTEMSADELTQVAESARAAESAVARSWILADAALRIAPLSVGTAAANTALSSLSAAVGAKTSTLENYRRVAAAYPPAKRDVPNTPFSSFQILYSRPHLIRPGMNTKKAHTLNAAHRDTEVDQLTREFGDEFPAPVSKPLAERMHDVARRIELAGPEPDVEIPFLVDAVVDVLDGDMAQVVLLLEQLGARVRWAATRPDGP